MISFLAPAISHAQEKHGETSSGSAQKASESGASGKAEKPATAFTPEEMDEMRQSQHLDNIASSNFQIQEFATYYFEQKGEPGVTPLLAHLKRHRNDPKTVTAVIYTLGRVGPKAARAAPIIARYLNDENMEIRTTSIAALGKIGKASDPFVPDIAKYLESDNESTKLLALRSLKQIGTPRSKSIATQYENQIKLEQERKNQQMMGNVPADDKNFVGPMPASPDRHSGLDPESKVNP